MVSFGDTLNRAHRTFQVQNSKYQDSWKNDGLDVRALIAEYNAKYRRLRQLCWFAHDQLDDETHRAKAVETCVDTVNYLLMIVRRIELEHGPVDPELLDREMDRT